MNLLQRVSRALGVTTRHILDQNGVVGDFHGDAVMGFWGWPLEQPDAAARAAMAALAIRAEFETAADRTGHPLSNFRIGLGIATGRAVAGKIGTVDQVTVTVFGPVVNVAARLEGMTKFIRAPILLDEVTAAAIREQLSPSVARVRKVARIRPYGMETSLLVSELLPSAVEYPQLSDEDVAAFESAVDAMFAGDWTSAHQTLHRIPADDRVKDFLTVYIAKHDRTPPANWDRVITLEQK
jgi:adenylate cyclase